MGALSNRYELPKGPDDGIPYGDMVQLFERRWPGLAERVRELRNVVQNPGVQLSEIEVRDWEGVASYVLRDIDLAITHTLEILRHRVVPVEDRRVVQR